MGEKKGIRPRKIPLRQCTGCGERKEKKELVRIIKTPEDQIMIDLTGKKNGRGAYICNSTECLRKARKRKSLERSLKMVIPDEIYEELEKEGFIYTVPGKGCYVSAKNTELIKEANLRKIEEYMDEITKLAVSCNLSRNELIEMLDFSLEENRE